MVHIERVPIARVSRAVVYENDRKLPLSKIVEEEAPDLAFTGVMLPDTNNSFVFEKAKKLLGTRLAYYRRYSEMSSEWIGADSWNSDGASAY